MSTANQDIRRAAKEAGVYLWQVADAYGGLRDNEFSRKLRKELPASEKTTILTIIEKLAHGAVQP